MFIAPNNSTRTVYKKDGKEHNPAGPAIHWGDTENFSIWMLEGKYHRYYGEAYIVSLSREWFIHGKIIK